MNRLPLVLSVAALAVAVLGSTPAGEAAREAVFPRNSVGTAQLKAAAVTSAKVRNGTIARVDLASSALVSGPQGPKGDKGDKGEKGEKGDRGDKGTKGDPGLSAYELVDGPLVSVPANGQTDANVNCPAGKKPIGGGGWWPGGYLWRSHAHPVGNPTGWIAGFTNVKPTAGLARVYVVCAAVAP